MARNSIQRNKKRLKEAPKTTWVNRYGKPLTGSSNNNKEEKRPVGGQGGRKSRYSSGVSRNIDELTIKKKKKNRRGREVG